MYIENTVNLVDVNKIGLFLTQILSFWEDPNVRYWVTVGCLAFVAINAIMTVFPSPFGNNNNKKTPTSELSPKEKRILLQSYLDTIIDNQYKINDILNNPQELSSTYIDEEIKEGLRILYDESLDWDKRLELINELPEFLKELRQGATGHTWIFGEHYTVDKNWKQYG